MTRPIASETRLRARMSHLSRRQMLSALAVVVAAPAQAESGHRLIMVEEEGCVYCRRWHAEVGPAYEKSAEGAFAPLERARIGDASVGGFSGLRYTPTFVLVAGRTEIGRITGYPGADFFWGLLAELLAKTPFKAQSTDEIKT